MFNLLKIITTFIMALFISGCSKLGALNTLLPKDGNTARVIKDMPYGEFDRQKLDIYIPRTDEAKEQSLPVVVFFYGGAWNSGRRQEYSFVGHALTSKNMIAVIADYRLVPQIRFPDFVLDSARAVEWVAQQIGQYGGDRQKIFVAGHSAGAYNAMMVGLADGLFREEQISLPDIAGVVGLAGPYDFLPMKYPSTRAAFEGWKDLQQTQPVNYLTGKSPPLLLITGVDDVRVAPRHSSTMHALAQELGTEAELHNYVDLGHAKLVLSLARPFRNWAPTLEHIDRFVSRHSG